MDRHALAAGDVADDLLAADRIAAAGAEHHQVVDAAHLDLLLAGAEHARRTTEAIPVSGVSFSCSCGTSFASTAFADSLP